MHPTVVDILPPMRLALVAIALLGGCLTENDEFVEPAALYEDCSVDPGACRDDLVCFEVDDLLQGDPGHVCVPFECDRDEDCPAPEDATAQPACRGSDVCTLDCTPRVCLAGQECPPCPEGRSCAIGCDPEANPVRCLACPEGMECIPMSMTMDGRLVSTCGYR